MAGEEEDEKVRLFVGQVPRSMTAEQPLAERRPAPTGPPSSATGTPAQSGQDRWARSCVSSGAQSLVLAVAEKERLGVLLAQGAASWCARRGRRPTRPSPTTTSGPSPETQAFRRYASRSVKEHEVSALFSKYGNIRELKLLRSPQQTSKACAILNFESKEHARASIEALNGRRVLLDGSNVTLVVKWADTEKERQARKAQKAQSQTS